MITVYFEDHGQDFLEWDIKDGVVVGCRPLQEWVWKGTKVHLPLTTKTGRELVPADTYIRPGDILHITLKTGEQTTLKYPVEKVLKR